MEGRVFWFVHTDQHQVLDTLFWIMTWTWIKIHSAILDLFRDFHHRMVYEYIASCRLIENLRKLMITAGRATVTKPFSDNVADA